MVEKRSGGRSHLAWSGVTVAVVQSDSSGHKRAPEAFCLTLQLNESVAEGAPHLPSAQLQPNHRAGPLYQLI